MNRKFLKILKIVTIPVILLVVVYVSAMRLAASFINVMEADLKPGEGANPEYHRRYADLQIDITGGEGWGYATAPGEEVGTFTGDIGFQNSPDAVTGSLGEGRFVLFFPGELHKPGVARPECTKVRKAVVKIRMEDKA